MTTDFTDHVPTVRAEVLGQPSAGVYEVALFEDNLWWTPEQVEGLVGQRPALTDEYRETRAAYVISRAWKADGMIVVRMEPYQGADDDN